MTGRALRLAVLTALAVVCAQPSPAAAALQPSGFVVATPPGLANVNTDVVGIVAPAPHLAYVAGTIWNPAVARNTALLDRWSGSTWTRIPVAVPAGTAAADVVSIAGTTATSVWVAGYAGPTGGPFGLFLERFDGHNWHHLSVPARYDNDMLLSIASSGPNDVWAQFHSTADPFPCPGLTTFLAHWNGSSWSQPGAWSDCQGSTEGVRWRGMASTGPGTAWMYGAVFSAANAPRLLGTAEADCRGVSCPGQPESCPGTTTPAPYSSIEVDGAGGPPSSTWLVGFWQTFNNAGDRLTPWSPWVCHWNGSAWTDLSPHYKSWKTNNAFRGIVQLPDGTPWAVGLQASGRQTLIMKRTATGWLNMTSPNPGGAANELDSIVHQTGTLSGMWALGSYEDSWDNGDPIPLLLYHP